MSMVESERKLKVAVLNKDTYVESEMTESTHATEVKCSPRFAYQKDHRSLAQGMAFTNSLIGS